MQRSSYDNTESYADYSQTQGQWSHEQEDKVAGPISSKIGCAHCREKLQRIFTARSTFSICRKYEAFNDSIIRSINWAAIASSVVVLDLQGNFLTTVSIQLLVQYNWPRLEMFSLSNNLIDTNGSVFLSRLRAPNLQILDLSGNQIKDEGFTVLLDVGWKALKYLKLRRIGIIQTFASLPWSGLRQLQLSQNGISWAGVKIIVSGRFFFLCKLMMDDCGLDDAALTELVKGQWSLLQKNSLRYNSFTTKGARYLLEANWPKLQSLSLTFDCNLSNGLRVFSKVPSKILERDGQSFGKWRQSITHKEIDNQSVVFDYLMNEQRLLRKVNQL